MMNFDFTPVVRGSYKRFLMLPACIGLVMVIALQVLGHPEAALSLFRGFVVGLLDTVILVRGMKKALPYVKDPQLGLAIMKRHRWYRVLSASSIIILLLRQGANVAGVCMGLLLIHIFLLFNLTIIAYQLNKEGEREERREK